MFICTRYWLKSVIVLIAMTGVITQPIFAQQSADGPPKRLEKVVVESERVTGSEEIKIDPRESGSASPDASELVDDVAGAEVTSNGPLSGQVQYRGMTGQRMNVKLNDHAVMSGGPNLMDPALHYIPRALMEDLTMNRGIASVSDGIMTLGGSAKAQLKTSEFGPGEKYEYHGSLFGVGRTVDDGISGGGIVSYANENRRFHVMGSTDNGDDRESPLGTIKASEYDRQVSGVGFGLREDGDTYGINFRHTDTGKSGNPSLPMDIQYFNTEQGEANYSTTWEGHPLKVQFNYNDVDHKMDNFTLRPAIDFGNTVGPQPGPNLGFDGTDRRFVIAASDDLGIHLSRMVPYDGGNLEYGIDFAVHDHDATVFDPDSNFFVESFPEIERDRISGYAEWSGTVSKIWDFDGGIRLTQVDMSAGQASVGTVPAPLTRLQSTFNSSDRSAEDFNVDLFGRFSRELNENLDLEVALARKNRSPSYIERFAWVPVEATAGLADGNNYVGNQDLDPETSRDFEVAFDWNFGNAYFTPRFFYRNVDDYIQGTASDSTPGTVNTDIERVSRVNADTTPLQYNNVEAVIYGMDATWGHDLPEYDRWRVNGTVSYLVGERDDINDDLYRFAPSKATVNLNYRPEDWLVTAQGEFVQEQDDVSETNDEPTTAGFGLMNLTARWFKGERTTVTFSLNNVFDKTYRRHLSGFNRTQNSAVPVERSSRGRLPGNERNFVANVSYEW